MELDHRQLPLFNRIALSLMERKAEANESGDEGNRLPENARLLALLNLAMAMLHRLLGS